ncbi:uncharacterized protein EKO05_0006865 [Ascochyta rabiei]|uniref:uncharacterized protein n=1 Tax=Didymella rabiei TaxID=5454 RepID=UPI0022080D94|nr:uncharacterized protein EKO05_0006865 [Ascochyta rabiei]UPX16467.1 hypothetical protein EKO05_0006865 [Ascochyta rabiei]
MAGNENPGNFANRPKEEYVEQRIRVPKSALTTGKGPEHCLQGWPGISQWRLCIDGRRQATQSRISGSKGFVR